MTPSCHFMMNSQHLLLILPGFFIFQHWFHFSFNPKLPNPLSLTVCSPCITIACPESLLSCSPVDCVLMGKHTHTSYSVRERFEFSLCANYGFLLPKCELISLFPNFSLFICIIMTVLTMYGSVQIE